MTEENYELAEPKPEALIESLRAVGYTLETAVADIIDNSIAASARNVWVNFHWDGQKSYISVLDDGVGMDEKELSNAMRPGSQSPLETRSEKDLGRFGLGLKTASFSQARCLTVLSKKQDLPTCTRKWDLYYVIESKQWRLLKSAGESGEFCESQIKDLQSGTLVLWQNMDRLTEGTTTNDAKARDHFNQQIEEVREHLGMIFHRYLSGPSERLSIWINGREKQNRVKPWDPFVTAHDSTLLMPTDQIDFGSEVVAIKGYVLPHKDRFDSDEDCSRAAGPNGWNAQQGFYIYRNDRMLVSGEWLKLGRPRPWAKQEHYRLARLSIDIPNNIDSEWSLYVKKSTAKPPPQIKQKLFKLAADTREKARQVFAHRGEYGPRGTYNQEELTRPWASSVRSGHTIYKIDREHILIRNLLKQAGKTRPEVEAALRFLEETVPVQKIWLNAAEDNADYAKPYEDLDDDIIFTDMRRVWEILRKSNIGSNEAKTTIRSMEPFNHYTKLIDQLD